MEVKAYSLLGKDYVKKCSIEDKSKCFNLNKDCKYRRETKKYLLEIYSEGHPDIDMSEQNFKFSICQLKLEGKLCIFDKGLEKEVK